MVLFVLALMSQTCYQIMDKDFHTGVTSLNLLLLSLVHFLLSNPMMAYLTTKVANRTHSYIPTFLVSLLLFCFDKNGFDVQFLSFNCKNHSIFIL